MRFIETPLPGAWVIELDLLGDERGWFARTFDTSEFEAHGLDSVVVQCNASFNARRDTLRGMHYQLDFLHEDHVPSAETLERYRVLVVAQPCMSGKLISPSTVRIAALPPTLTKQRGPTGGGTLKTPCSPHVAALSGSEPVRIASSP